MSTGPTPKFSRRKHVLEPILIGDLAATLAVGSHELVTLVGGGGKTTAAFALGEQIGPSTVITTTTKMGSTRTAGHVPLLDPTDLELRAAMAERGTVLAWSGDDGRRGLGVRPEVCDRWFDIADHVIVEADGSRRLPFKAPNRTEPVIPSRTTLLAACAGSHAFSGVIADVCHRPDRVAAIAGCRVDDRLTPARLVAVLLSREGSRKGCPPAARFAVLLHRVTPSHLAYIDEVATRVGDGATVVAVASFAPGAGSRSSRPGPAITR